MKISCQKLMHTFSGLTFIGDSAAAILQQLQPFISKTDLSKKHADGSVFSGVPCPVYAKQRFYGQNIGIKPINVISHDLFGISGEFP